MSSSKQTSLWYLIIIFLLLALCGYFWYSNTQLKNEFKRHQTELFELEKVQTELDKDYQDALETIENLRDDSKELNALIENQKNELKERKDKINNLIWTKRELGKAKDEIAGLKGLTDQYVTEINTLKAQNAQLKSANKTLTKEKETLTVSLETTTKVKNELAVAKTILTAENEELNVRKMQLSSTVDKASVIKINWLQVKGMELKDDGKVKEQKRAKKANVLRICFKTETNTVTAPGEEKFQVRYIDPTGETLAIESLGSGVLFDNWTNQDVRYSIEGSFAYDNTETENCIDWQPNYPLIKGEYEVFMYNKGYECGKGNFKLK